MKFREIINIWDLDLDLLSNSDRAKVYFERTKQVVIRALADECERPLAIRNGRICRSYVVAKIGCQPAVTAQNPKIRQFLSDVDADLGSNRE